MEVIYAFQQTPTAVVVDLEDNLVVATYSQENDSKDTIDTFEYTNGKAHLKASKETPARKLGINSKGELYMGSKERIQKLTKEGDVITIARSKNPSEFGEMWGMCVDERDSIIFCDPKFHCVGKATPDGQLLTVCGKGVPGYKDGNVKKAKFNFPWGIIYEKSTKLLYVADYYNNAIRTIHPDGNVKTLCKLKEGPRVLAMDGEGKLYVSMANDEIVTLDKKGNVSFLLKLNCNGMAFNRKGDLFMTARSEKKLYVLRNCTQFPPSFPTSIVSLSLEKPNEGTLKKGNNTHNTF